MTYLPAWPERPRTSWHVCPPGDAATWCTVEQMDRLICDGAHHPEVKAAYTGKSPAELRAWLDAHTVYQDDPPGLELVRAAHVQLREIQATGRAAGDCDDVAVLAGALALARGWGARLILAGFGRGWEHVWTEAREPGGEWVELDVTRPAALPYGAGLTETAEVRLCT